MKLSSSVLKRIIREEAAKFGDGRDTEDAAKDTEEVEPDELADSLEKHVDYVKACKLEEARAIRRVKKLRENRKRALAKIVKIVKGL